jgi:lipopolysaccharide export system protein LptA
MPRRWLLLVTASLGPLSLAFVWHQIGVSREGAAPPPVAGEDGPAVVFYNHVERIRDRRGKVAWTFDAEKVEVLLSGDYLITNLRIGEFYRNGLPEGNLRADRARIDTRTQNVGAVGHVKLVSARGVVFEGHSVYWFEREGRLVAPKVDRLEWQRSSDPKAKPVRIDTERLFYWPGKSLLELPDRLKVTSGNDRLEAAAGAALVDQGKLRLAGPVDASFNVTPEMARQAGAAGGAKLVTASVAAGGRVNYDKGASRVDLTGDVTVLVPADGLSVRSREATVNTVSRVVTGTGNLVFVDRVNTLTATSGTVDTRAQRAAFRGPVELLHRGSGGPLQVSAPALTLSYRTGARSASAQGGVRLVATDARVTAQRLAADLERERAVMAGRVDLTTAPRPMASPDPRDEGRREPVRLRSGRLVYTFGAGRRSAEATASPRFQQGDREGTSQVVRYDQERDVVVLDRNVRLWNRDGEKARCGRLTYDLRRNEMRVERPISAEVYLEEPG